MTLTPTTPASIEVHDAGFLANDFAVFTIDGLEQRMAAIQSQIRPKFQALGEQLTAELAPSVGGELFLHVAKHARRTVNPPKDTWLALCENKRGYKAHPHFQLGLFEDHLFMWLAFIYELPSKSNVAATLLNELDTVIRTVPDDYVISLDHMKKDSTPVSGMDTDDWRTALVRFRDVKSAELLIGRHLQPNDPAVSDGEALLRTAQQTFETLMPLYRLATSQG
ncbi:YktB family protein [Paenibacillus kobensis]|uniref:YktB family protein n=1 Tax=Paenibacillus kobensis TaxID=59841 RepID=UPI000FDA768D|nr:DUF1054 domain-containing protein [Paenibacillus kobensis]